MVLKVFISDDRIICEEITRHIFVLRECSEKSGDYVVDVEKITVGCRAFQKLGNGVEDKLDFPEQKRKKIF